MTHRADVAHGRDIVARWCVLAEQRLEYLTELFETGRWRRFHSERAFLENIQEAKAAVETWRGLLMREASRDNSAVDISWLGRRSATLPGGDMLRDPAGRDPDRTASLRCFDSPGNRSRLLGRSAFRAGIGRANLGSRFRQRFGADAGYRSDRAALPAAAQRALIAASYLRMMRFPALPALSGSSSPAASLRRRQPAVPA